MLCFDPDYYDNLEKLKKERVKMMNAPFVKRNISVEQPELGF